jgi:acetoin utilization deacetylase AcuC-like enzyme
MTTLLAYVPATGHTKLHHPESHQRTAVLMPALENSGVLADLQRIEPVPATVEQLRRVHTVEHIEYVRQVSLKGGGLLDQGDTYVTADTFDLASLASGSCCAAVDQIMTGEVNNGFALIRPPGHHAETDRVSGFCIFNNVAAAARQAQVVHGVQRVAIVDFDVHHGNGTQDIFFEDDTVLFMSVHLYAPFFYPGVGGMHEIGVGRGKYHTLNIPFPPHVGDKGYQLAFDEIIGPRLANFRPELLLVSAGFDAHWQDPLAMAGLSLPGFAAITHKLIDYAKLHAQGRILFVLEGGYHLEVLANGVLNTLYALLEKDLIADPFGGMPEPEHDATALISRLREHYLLK